MRTDGQLRNLFNKTFDALPSEARSRIEDFWRQQRIPTEASDGTVHFIPQINKKGIILNRSVRPRPVMDWAGPTSTTSQMINQALRASELLPQSQGICGQTTGLIFQFKASVVDLT